MREKIEEPVQDKLLRGILLLILFASGGYSLKLTFVDTFGMDARIWGPAIGIACAVLFAVVLLAEERWRRNTPL